MSKRSRTEETEDERDGSDYDSGHDSDYESGYDSSHTGSDGINRVTTHYVRDDADWPDPGVISREEQLREV
jgi:hypothetical protein